MTLNTKLKVINENDCHYSQQQDEGFEAEACLLVLHVRLLAAALGAVSEQKFQLKR